MSKENKVSVELNGISVQLVEHNDGIIIQHEGNTVASLMKAKKVIKPPIESLSQADKIKEYKAQTQKERDRLGVIQPKNHSTFRYRSNSEV